MLAVVRNGPVLLCYDGSDRAEQAIRRSGALLDDPSAIVLYVGAGESAQTPAEDGHRLALETGFDPVSVVDDATGPVAETILAHAERHGVAAIVVGSRGLSASRATILGSVSSRVTQNARHPVLVVPPGPHSEPVWGPVFVCYDGSDAAGDAIATAGKLLARRDAILAYFLPAVDDGVVLQSTLPWPVSSAVQDRLAALDREEAGRPVRVAAHGVEIARRAGLEARSLAVGEEGLAVDHEAVAWVRLTEAAAAESASCIVVGHRRSARGVSRLDSTAYGLVNHADRPVLVVPAT